MGLVGKFTHMVKLTRLIFKFCQVSTPRVYTAIVGIVETVTGRHPPAGYKDTDLIIQWLGKKSWGK
jgi:hypothetical protein